MVHADGLMPSAAVVVAVAVDLENVHEPDRWDTGALVDNKRPQQRPYCDELTIVDDDTGLIGRLHVDFVAVDDQGPSVAIGPHWDLFVAAAE